MERARDEPASIDLIEPVAFPRQSWMDKRIEVSETYWLLLAGFRLYKKLRSRLRSENYWDCVNLIGVSIIDISETRRFNSRATQIYAKADFFSTICVVSLVFEPLEKWVIDGITNGVGDSVKAFFCDLWLCSSPVLCLCGTPGESWRWSLRKPLHMRTIWESGSNCCLRVWLIFRNESLEVTVLVV